MNTLAWFLILAGIFIVRQAAHGRITHITKDLSDALLALTRNDTDALGEVLSRNGDDLTASESDINTWNDISTSALKAATGAASTVGKIGSGIDASIKGSLSFAAIARGQRAKGYKWTATGPDYYDCSGLMWRACQDTGIYNGPRFTTFTVGAISAFQRVSNPTVNDLVVWPTHHMGVVTGTDEFYSARNPRDGIGYSKISTFRNSKPVYYRPVHPPKKTGPFD